MASSNTPLKSLKDLGSVVARSISRFSIVTLIGSPLRIASVRGSVTLVTGFFGTISDAFAAASLAFSAACAASFTASIILPFSPPAIKSFINSNTPNPVARVPNTFNKSGTHPNEASFFATFVCTCIVLGKAD